MSKISDYSVSPEVNDIMEEILKAYPNVFPGFDTGKVGCVHTKKKKNSKKPLNLRPVRYPYDVWVDKTYICEVADNTWEEMSQKQKNLSVFHTMCSIPEGAFDEQSKNYGKKKKPDYELYSEEFAVTGGVPNWMENEDARDVFDAKKAKDKKAKSDGKADSKERKAVTKESVATIGEVDEFDDDEK